MQKKVKSTKPKVKTFCRIGFELIPESFKHFHCFPLSKKCLENSNRMAGLLTYSRTLNAFPASPNPSKGGEQRFKSIDLKLRSAQWHEFVQYVFLFLPLLISPSPHGEGWGEVVGVR